jgi:cell wall-associated NlpC family hydrolase
MAGVAGAVAASGYAVTRTGDIYSQYKSHAENPSWSNLKDRDSYLGLLNPIAAGAGATVGAWNRIKGMMGLGESGSQSFSGGAAAKAGGGGGGGSKGLASKSATGAALVAFAKRFVGTPYVWGGVTTKGWDCSGFTKYVFRQFGKNLPRVSRQQAGVGKEISYKNAQPGDLLFFGSPVHHVAIYAGNGMMVHAANRRLGTIVSKVWGGLTHVRRVLNTSVGGGTSGVGASPSTSMKETDSGSGDSSWNPLVGTNLSTGVSGISATLGSIMDVLGGSSGTGAPSQGGGDPGTTDTSEQAAKAASPSAGGGGTIAQAIKAAGFSGSLAKTMWAIAMAESSGNPRAHNTNARTGDNSYGLWQINMLGRMGPERRRLFGISNNDALFDPTTNARAAMAIYKQQGLNAWTTYKKGAHSRYMADAPGFSKGAWSIDKDQVANIHQGEMILPASLAHAVRTSLQRGATGGGGGGSNGPITINVYPAGASDSEAVRFGTKLKSVLDGKQTIETLRTT